MSRSRFTTVVLCGALAFAAFGHVQSAWADPILAGFDLFWTPPGGAFLDLTGMGGSIVQLQGNPIGPGDTDTIVERLQDIDPFPEPNGVGTIDIELVELSLVSIEPVNMSGMDWDLDVRLDPNIPSVGQMTIRHEHPNGGTFDSFFDVFVEVTFTQVGNLLNNFSVFVQDQLQGTAQPWSHIRPALYPENQQFPSGGFYPGVDPLNPELIPGVQHSGPHPQTFPAMPEPASLILLLLGGSALLRRRR